MDYKTLTTETYNKYASSFDDKFEDYFKRLVAEKADLFISRLKGPNVLDVGSGSGNHALYFKQKGLDVHCIDISSEMVELCKKKGLSAEVMDLENLSFAPGSYDGVWAYASLFHVPKANLPAVIASIRKILKPAGLFACAIKEGQGEGLEEHLKYPDTKRWWSYYTDEEFRKLLVPGFELMSFSRDDSRSKYTFLDYQWRLK